MRSPGSARLLAAAAVSITCIACTGTIGESHGEPTAGDETWGLTCDGPGPAGRVTMRRLNRTEYANTLRDLLGNVPARVWTLPQDDVSAGFDRMGEVLSMSSIHAELYLAIASEALDAALATQSALLPCQPTSLDDATCFGDIARAFGRRAFRRPLGSEEVTALDTLRVYAKTESASVNEAVRSLLEALLTSPHFLFRVEVEGGGEADSEELGAYELASRLSYYVWSSTPDEALLAAAGSGRLHSAADIEREVRRMLRDPKADALVTDFADQWLSLRTLDAATPDPRLYPGFDDALRAAMRDETRALFAKVLRENGDVRELLLAETTSLTPRLAQHYGVGASGGAFAPLPAGRAPGILGHASLLTLASHPNRTSPVKRGRLVLDSLLCAPPPPPPANVEGISADVDTSAPLREQMEAHRSKPECAQCHAAMDPLGFAFEAFDAVGLPRTRDDFGYPIDATGELPSGETFEGPAALAELLADDPRFVACAAKHLLAFAAGRVMRGRDQCTAEAIAQAVGQRGSGLEDLVVLVATSDVVRRRQTKGSLQ